MQRFNLNQRHETFSGVTTSYTTDGAAVGAAATFDTLMANAVARNAVGANAATTATETRSDALNSGTAPVPAVTPQGCSWLCIGVLVVVTYMIARSG